MELRKKSYADYEDAVSIWNIFNKHHPILPSSNVKDTNEPEDPATSLKVPKKRKKQSARSIEIVCCEWPGCKASFPRRLRNHHVQSVHLDKETGGNSSQEKTVLYEGDKKRKLK
jgi:hypothetical protein